MENLAAGFGFVPEIAMTVQHEKLRVRLFLTSGEQH
jgi:hypothetical protein